ncbi:hypothetical protein [Nonomuraea rubra]|uniref:Uncharacterized protein n=1 Tax=Nonomuraea rubra TaxID=46180 RepID=A0A7X0U107_9ACTN|nr:hypothetical protein [Nonomuraea rubra]MBB6551267.1 hypothetical protein [Nonomuraea rubra]
MDAVMAVTPAKETPHLARLSAARLPTSRTVTSHTRWRRVAGTLSMPNRAEPPSKALILASVPDGMRRTPTQQAWLRSLKEHPDVLTLRCDGSRNLMLIAAIICWSADWKTLCSRPTIARLVERTGLAKATVKRWVRWLRERRLAGRGRTRLHRALPQRHQRRPGRRRLRQPGGAVGAVPAATSPNRRSTQATDRAATTIK